MSELDNIIPPEVKNDKFYDAILRLASTEKIKSILEIGSSSGGGSTEAFVEGIKKNPAAPKLFCMEVSRTRFQALSGRYGNVPSVRCYNVSSVPITEFPTRAEIVKFYSTVPTALNQYPLNQVLGWLDQDINYIKEHQVEQSGIEFIKLHNHIDVFDMVLIDGSEFAGKAELEHIYGARFILLDDVNGFKNSDNYKRLKSDSHYELVEEDWKTRNGYAIFKRKEHQLPIHIFTIVLNGLPFIKHHIEEFRKLSGEWHWHIIEGVADLKHDTAWSVPNGAKIPAEFHRDGLSSDGTSEYLDQLASSYPQNITLYRKPKGEFWDGKIEMIRSFIPRINSESVLLQVDSDELWVTSQLEQLRELFERNLTKTAAYFHCDYFVGPNKYVSSLNSWATYPTDWLRAWRFVPGMKWLSHEPPVLVDAKGRDSAQQDPFTRDHTRSLGLTFQHCSYVTVDQVRFKEAYYGYVDATESWSKLQKVVGPVRPSDYLPWAGVDAVVDDWPAEKGEKLGDRYLGEPVQSKKYSSMSVDAETQFEKEVRELFKRIRPNKIIETGTYLGRGTSSIIWRALKENGISADFTTIEVNPEHHRQAVEWFNQNGMNIRAELGLSLPRALLPTKEQIKKLFVENKEFSGIYYDHNESQRDELYFSETSFDVPDNLLYKTMQRYDFRPDFVLLDSAGHVGYLEFKHFMTMVKGECYVMLDDVYHCKHFKTLNEIKKDPRFEVVVESPEKFGFCLAKFSPNVAVESKDYGKPIDGVKSVLWIRTDSIGDNVLASGMLEPIRAKYAQAKITIVCEDKVGDLYKACPHHNELITYNRKAVLEDENYRQQFVMKLQQVNADLCLNSVYSREVLNDFLAISSKAQERIALKGDLSNISEEDRTNHNKYYTRVIDLPEKVVPETTRHRDFLNAIGIDCSQVKATVWISDSDKMIVDRMTSFAGLEKDRTIALFAAAQWDIKSYDKFVPALSRFCQRHSLSIVALGGAADWDVNQAILDRLPVRTFNCCGETSLTESAALLKRCRLAVGVDSSPAHLACAVGTPNVVVMGGGHFGRFFPYSNLTSLVCQPLECYWCNWKCKFATAHCIKGIEPELIEAALEETIASASDKARVFVPQKMPPSLLRLSNVNIEGALDPAMTRIIEVDCTREIERPTAGAV